MNRYHRCATVRVLRIQRRIKPIVRFVDRRIVRSSVATFVPSVLHDTIVHHKAVTAFQLLNVAEDDLSMTTILALSLYIAHKIKLELQSSKD
jgi:hypothetical protein